MSQTNDNRTQHRAQRPAQAQHHARRLTPEQRRRILEIRRRQRRKKQLMIAIPAAVALIAVVAVGLSFALRGRGGDGIDAAPKGQEASEAISFAEIMPDVAAEGEGTEGADAEAAPGEEAPEGEGELAPETSTKATVEPVATENPNQYNPPGGVFVFDDAYVAAARGQDTGPAIEADMSTIDPTKLDRWPDPLEGYLPVVYSAETTENVIAVTVDDCYQSANLREIVQCALDNGARLTIFPIGENLAKERIGEAGKWAWESGMEIENHSYKHLGTYHYDDEYMIHDIWEQSNVLNQVLGVNYKQHFFRPKGGDERRDQRTHAYVNQLGMTAIAMWGYSGSSNGISKICANLEPGQIYLFHTTDKDKDKLLQFIPYAVQQGYRLVTLNELFGFPDNETSDLSTAAKEAPALESFHIIPRELKKTSYMRAAAVVQKRLIELGYLKGDADGVFGETSYKATGYFQVAMGLKADGVAGTETQEALFSDDAISYSDAKKARK